MEADKGRLFELLDRYARTRHSCFLAEITSTDEGYSLCFRPVGEAVTPEERYFCRYLAIGTDEAKLLISKRLLTKSIASWLDSELPRLSKSKE